MPIYHQGRKVKEVYHQGRKVKEIWHMGRRVYSSSKPVEVMPPMTGDFWAQSWLRGKLAEYGEDYKTVTELPFDIDSRNAANMRSMFSDCSSLTSVPELDTRQVTTMRSMFFRCSSLTSVPQMDTSQVTDMAYMFSDCSSLTSVPELDTRQVRDMTKMFWNCARLTDGNVRLNGRRLFVTTTDMITGSGLTREPFITIE